MIRTYELIMSVTNHLLSVREAAEARKSIRKYTGEEVPEADLREILRIAGLAPSPWNVQPWRVIVVRDHDERQKLMAAAYGQKQVGAASAVFVIYSDMKDAMATVDEFIHPGYPEDQRPGVKKQIVDNFERLGDEASERWGYAESNIFLGFLLLAAQSLGYSTSPMLGFDPEQVRELYKLPANVTFPAIVAIGVGAEAGFPHHRHAVDRFAKFI